MLNLHVGVDRLSELLQTLLCITLEVLEDVFKIVFFAEIKL